jgi:hypothetical protein
VNFMMVWLTLTPAVIVIDRTGGNSPRSTS